MSNGFLEMSMFDTWLSKDAIIYSDIDNERPPFGIDQTHLPYYTCVYSKKSFMYRADHEAIVLINF